MKWFKTEFYEIKEVEVERESDKCVWVYGKWGNRKTASRAEKVTNFECYFPTWEEARNYLLYKANLELDGAMTRLERAKKAVCEIEAMRKPEEPCK